MSDTKRTTAPVSRGGRFMKLAGMTASVAGSYAKTRVRSMFSGEEQDASENWKETGELIAKTLGELKGAVMKVGQVASQARDLFPPEIANALATLQNEAPPMPYEVIEKQIEREFGMSPDRLFAWFDPEPFAAASIGQVHRARTDDGREVVVKVQYPGVDESCDSDLAHLKLALRAAGVLKLNRRAMNEMFEELRVRLHEELDYCNEADNVRLFQELHKNDPGIVIPSVVGERSSKRVLTMTWEPGDHIDRLDPSTYSQETRNLLGQRVFEAFARQIFVYKTVHGDPHPGNFAFRPDGSVVMYDFGCVKKLDPAIVDAYIGVIRHGIRREWEALDQSMLDVGARIPDGPKLDGDFYGPWRDVVATPFGANQPFDFGHSTLHTQFARMAPRALKHLDSLQPPSETIFVDRVIGGHYYTMMKLGVVQDFRPLVCQYTGLSEDDLRTGGML